MTALMQTTRIAIMIEADTELVSALTVLAALVLALAGPVKSIVIFAADVLEAASFTGKVLTIGFTALAFGLLGVRL